jgi:hypothetical protein
MGVRPTLCALESWLRSAGRDGLRLQARVELREVPSSNYTVTQTRRLSPTCLLVAHHLEDQFQRQLNGARPADLVERVQSCISVTLREHGGRLAESAVTHTTVDGPEIGVVEDVEKFAAKLKVGSLGEIKLAQSAELASRSEARLVTSG